MTLRRHDHCSIRGAFAEDRLERVERRDFHAERRRLRSNVGRLPCIDDSRDLVVHAPSQPRKRIGNRRRADYDEDAGLNEWLDIHVHSSFRCAGHRDHDVLGGRLDAVGRVGSNRYKTAMSCAQ